MKRVNLAKKAGLFFTVLAVSASFLACGTEKKIDTEVGKIVKEAEIEEVKEDVTAVKVHNVRFDIKRENNEEYALIQGLESDNIVWSIETEKYEAAQLDSVSPIGVFEDKYFYVEGGSVVALNLEDGSTLWKNGDFKGSGTASLIGNDGTIYLCGAFGPDFFAVDSEGNTLSRIDQFEADMFGACQLEMDGDSIKVIIADDSGLDQTVFRVNRQDFNYEKIDYISSVYTNEQLCQMARSYYEMISGSNSPEHVEIESEDENMVSIWLYQDFGDHVATMDRYVVDRTTGKGTNTKGDDIDLTLK